MFSHAVRNAQPPTSHYSDFAPPEGPFPSAGAAFRPWRPTILALIFLFLLRFQNEGRRNDGAGRRRASSMHTCMCACPPVRAMLRHLACSDETLEPLIASHPARRGSPVGAAFQSEPSGSCSPPGLRRGLPRECRYCAGAEGAARPLSTTMPAVAVLAGMVNAGLAWPPLSACRVDERRRRRSTCATWKSLVIALHVNVPVDPVLLQASSTESLSNEIAAANHNG